MVRAFGIQSGTAITDCAEVNELRKVEFFVCQK